MILDPNKPLVVQVSCELVIPGSWILTCRDFGIRIEAPCCGQAAFQELADKIVALVLADIDDGVNPFIRTALSDGGPWRTMRIFGWEKGVGRAFCEVDRWRSQAADGF